MPVPTSRSSTVGEGLVEAVTTLLRYLGTLQDVLPGTATYHQLLGGIGEAMVNVEVLRQEAGLPPDPHYNEMLDRLDALLRGDP